MFLRLQVCELSPTYWFKKNRWERKESESRPTLQQVTRNSKVKMLPQLTKGVDKHIHDVAKSVMHHQHKHAHVSRLAKSVSRGPPTGIRKTDGTGKNQKAETNSAACIKRRNSKVKMLPPLTEGVDEHIHDVAHFGCPVELFHTHLGCLG